VKSEELADLAADGDRYHRVNYHGIGTIADPIFTRMEAIHVVSPIRTVLEIGCTTGFRLDKARQAFGAQCSGLEISAAAVAEGGEKFPEIDIKEGVAPADLDHWAGKQFDVIVVGHLLYLLPRSELFEFAAKVDSLLAEGGHLIVMDFMYHRDTVSSYLHQDALKVYKGDPSGAWTWNPQYFLVNREIYSLASNPQSQQAPSQWQTLDVLLKLRLDESYENVQAPESVHENADLE